MNDAAAVFELCLKAEALPNGPARVAAFADAARRADALAAGGSGDDGLAFGVRLALLTTAMGAWRYDIALPTFSRLLAEHDADPDRFPADPLLTTYPAVLEGATTFPEVSRARLDGLVADYERRALAAGVADSEVAAGLMHVSQAVGELDRTRALFRRASNPWGGHFAGCGYCRTRQRLYYAFSLDDVAGVVDAADRLLGDHPSGTTLKCGVYQFFGRLEPLSLRSLELSGRYETAAARHAVGLRVLAREPHRLFEAGLHLEYLARRVRLGRTDPRGLRRLLRRSVPHLVDRTPDERMQYLRAAAHAAAVLGEGGRALTLRLPHGDPLHPVGRGDTDDAEAPARYRLEELAAAMDAEAEVLSRAFDRRNGNGHHLTLHRRCREFVYGGASPGGDG